MLLAEALAFLNYTKYTDAKEYLDRPFNETEFPSSYFLQSHDYPNLFIKTTVIPLCLSDQAEEEQVFDLTDEERDNRLKYEYVYNKRGERWYSIHDGYLRHERNDSKTSCLWKRYKGKCIIHTVADDIWHTGHIRVNFEFQPAMTKQLASDLNESLKVDFFNPTYTFVATHGIRVGNVYECTKRKLIRGPRSCHDFDYDFDYVEAEIEKLERDK